MTFLKWRRGETGAVGNDAHEPADASGEKVAVARKEQNHGTAGLCNGAL